MNKPRYARQPTHKGISPDKHELTPAEISRSVQADIEDLLKGMGKSRYSLAAGRHMAPEPVRHIDPASPEGQAIAARFGQPP